MLIFAILSILPFILCLIPNNYECASDIPFKAEINELRSMIGRELARLRTKSDPEHQLISFNLLSEYHHYLEWQNQLLQSMLQKHPKGCSTRPPSYLPHQRTKKHMHGKTVLRSRRLRGNYRRVAPHQGRPLVKEPLKQGFEQSILFRGSIYNPAGQQSLFRSQNEIQGNGRLLKRHHQFNQAMMKKRLAKKTAMSKKYNIHQGNKLVKRRLELERRTRQLHGRVRKHLHQVKKFVHSVPSAVQKADNQIQQLENSFNSASTWQSSPSG